MRGVEPGQGADAKRTEEFLRVEHSREDAAKPVRSDQGDDTSVLDAAVSRSGGVDAIDEFRHPPQPFVVSGHCPWNPVPILRFSDARGADRQQAYHGPYFEPCGAAVWKAEDVIVEAVLVVPHTVRAKAIHGARDPQKVIDELSRHVVVARF